MRRIFFYVTTILTLAIFRLQKVEMQDSFSSRGVPYLSNKGYMSFGRNFTINNILIANPIGRNYKSAFVIKKNASLIIGSNVGVSGATIVCHRKVIIGNNVKLGGNVCVYDTDFHSINSSERFDIEADQNFTIREEVTIEDGVFIGAHSTILKGVRIGKNSVIGACSLVSKDIPSNEIWGGNPARFIRKIKI
jgi:acetyltransferase-like isoleucine patch superfamily enzyme